MTTKPYKADLVKRITELEALVKVADQDKKDLAEAIWSVAREDHGLCDDGVQDFIRDHLGEEYVPGLPVSFFFGFARVNPDGGMYGDDSIKSMLVNGQGLSDSEEWKAVELLLDKDLSMDAAAKLFKTVLKTLAPPYMADDKAQTRSDDVPFDAHKYL